MLSSPTRRATAVPTLDHSSYVSWAPSLPARPVCQLSKSGWVKRARSWSRVLADSLASSGSTSISGPAWPGSSLRTTDR